MRIDEYFIDASPEKPKVVLLDELELGQLMFEAVEGVWPVTLGEMRILSEIACLYFAARVQAASEPDKAH